MDKASPSGGEDWGFESLQGQNMLFNLVNIKEKLKDGFNEHRKPVDKHNYRSKPSTSRRRANKQQVHWPAWRALCSIYSLFKSLYFAQQKKGVFAQQKVENCSMAQKLQNSLLTWKPNVHLCTWTCACIEVSNIFHVMDCHDLKVLASFKFPLPNYY